MRVLICGDRNWTDREKIAQQLRLLHLIYDRAYWETDGFITGTSVDMLTIMHGAARGADTIADEEASKLGFRIQAFPADWLLGRRAGSIRNQVMLEQHPDLVLAFHSNIEESKGTKDMVKRARAAGIPTEVIK